MTYAETLLDKGWRIRLTKDGTEVLAVAERMGYDGDRMKNVVKVRQESSGATIEEALDRLAGGKIENLKRLRT